MMLKNNTAIPNWLEQPDKTRIEETYFRSNFCIQPQNYPALKNIFKRKYYECIQINGSFFPLANFTLL